MKILLSLLLWALLFTTGYLLELESAFTLYVSFMGVAWLWLFFRLQSVFQEGEEKRRELEPIDWDVKSGRRW